MFITFDAWRDDDRYVGLAELLVRLGGLGLDLEWTATVTEAAPEPGGERLETLDGSQRLRTLALLAMVAPDLQVIDGVFEAYRDDRFLLRIRAAGGEHWDVETEDAALANLYRLTYDGKDVTESAT